MGADSNESSEKPGRSLVSIAESAGIAAGIRKLEDETAWEPCSQCGGSYMVGILRGKPCPECADRTKWEEQDRAQEVLACGGERGYRLFTREAFKRSPGNSAAMVAADRFSPRTDNLYIWGSCGTGKSHVAAIIGREFAAGCAFASGLVIFTEPAPLLRSLRGLTPQEERARMDELIKVPVLILDDLGIEKDTEFAIATISEIVSHRLKSDRNGLVVTSNLSLDALAAKLHDDRLTSRLAGMCQVIEIKGQDMRLQGNA